MAAVRTSKPVMKKTKSTPVSVRPRPNLASMLANLWSEPEDMTEAFARRILEHEWDTTERSRKKELLERNRTVGLTTDEAKELDDYITMGDLIGILRIRARKKLKIKFNYNARS